MAKWHVTGTRENLVCLQLTRKTSSQRDLHDELQRNTRSNTARNTHTASVHMVNRSYMSDFRKDPQAFMGIRTFLQFLPSPFTQPPWRFREPPTAKTTISSDGEAMPDFKAVVSSCSFKRALFCCCCEVVQFELKNLSARFLLLFTKDSFQYSIMSVSSWV